MSAQDMVAAFSKLIVEVETATASMRTLVWQLLQMDHDENHDDEFHLETCQLCRKEYAVMEAASNRGDST